MQFQRKYRVTVNSGVYGIVNPPETYASVLTSWQARHGSSQQSTLDGTSAWEDYQLQQGRSGSVTQWVIEDLRCNMRIQAGTSESPNTTSIKIYNLNENSRNQLHRSQLASIKVEAGYVHGQYGVVFQGQVRKAHSKLDQVDWITEIEAADSEVAIQTCQVSTSIKSTYWSKTVFSLQDTVKSYIAPGNIQQAVSDAVARMESDKRIQGDPILPRGASCHGSGVAAVREVLAQKGLTASIDKGAWLVLHPTSGRNPAIILNSNTGLVGYPEVATATKKKGASQLKIKCLMNPLIDAGRLLVVDLPAFKNQTYRVESLEHAGDSWDGDWHTEVVATRIS